LDYELLKKILTLVFIQKILTCLFSLGFQKFTHHRQL